MRIQHKMCDAEMCLQRGSVCWCVVGLRSRKAPHWVPEIATIHKSLGEGKTNLFRCVIGVTTGQVRCHHICFIQGEWAPTASCLHYHYHLSHHKSKRERVCVCVIVSLFPYKRSHPQTKSHTLRLVPQIYLWNEFQQCWITFISKCHQN